MPDATGRFGLMKAASKLIRRAGYLAIGLDHFAKPADSLALSQAEGRLRRNFQGYTSDQSSSLIGFGTSAIGTLPEGYIQNTARTVAYRDAITADRLATARGIALTAEDRIRRSVIERLMCDLEVDLEHVSDGEGCLPAAFAEEIEAIDKMACEGLVVRDGLRITVPDDARPFLRSVCAVFDRYVRQSSTRHSRAV
jgi:oxygen-independent coproporphyrinogen-3 oxidase